MIPGKRISRSTNLPHEMSSARAEYMITITCPNHDRWPTVYMLTSVETEPSPSPTIDCSHGCQTESCLEFILIRLQNFNFNWPKMLDCNSLPEKPDKSNLCMEAPSADDMDPETESDVIPGGFERNSELLQLLEQLSGPSTKPPTVPPVARQPGCPDRSVYRTLA